MSYSLKPDDRFRLTKVGDPQLSPDGTRVAFVTENANLEDDEVDSAIWLVPTDGSAEPRRLTALGGGAGQPRWSPDGRRLAFVSDRDGRSQLYVMDVTGGEPEVVATEEPPASPPVWSPDGGRLAFTAWTTAAGDERLTYPGAPASVEGEDEAQNGEEVRVVMTTLRNRLEGVGFYNGRNQHIYVVDADPTLPGEKAEASRITDGPFFHGSPAWSPDGKWIACTASRDEPHDDWTFDRRLWVFSTESDERYRVLDAPYPAYGPSWSPDGTRLAFFGQAGPFNWLSTPNHLFVIEVAHGQTQSWDAVSWASEGLDRNIGAAASSETRKPGEAFAAPRWWDDTTLIAPVADESTSHLYRFCAAGDREPERITGGVRRAAADPDARGGTIVFMSSAPTEPDQVFVIDDDGAERCLSTFNADVVADWPLSPSEVLEYASTDGCKIQGWFLRAWGSESGEARPLVLQVHGGPSGMFGEGFSFTDHFFASHGYHVLCVNPRGSSGYGTEFQWAVVGDWGGKDFEDIMAGVDLVVQRGEADEGHLGITGWSYGGFMTNWAITQTDRFSAAVSGASSSNQRSKFGTADVGPGFVTLSMGCRPWEDQEKMNRHSPVHYVDRVKTPVLFLHGEGDLRCHVGQADEMYASVKEQGKTAVMVRYIGESHGLKRPCNVADRWQRTLAWFDHYLKGDG